MSETDLAPFRLPEKELLRESGLAWEGRGCMWAFDSRDPVDEAPRAKLSRASAVPRDRGRISGDPLAFLFTKGAFSLTKHGGSGLGLV